MNQLVWTDNLRIQLSAEQVSVDLDDEAATLGLKGETYFGLNLVGTRIWTPIRDTPRTFGEVRQTIPDETDVTFEQCDADLRELLGQRRDQGLIEIVDEASL